MSYFDFGVNLFRITSGVRQVWEDRPDLIALLALGLIVFVFVVLDARRCRRRNKNKESRKY